MHESLLLDDKDQKLTRSEKELAQRSYEHDKMKGGRPSARSYSPPARLASYSPPLPPPPPPADRLLAVSFSVLSTV